MDVLPTVYWLLAGLLFYTYVGYGMLVWLLSGFKQKTLIADTQDWPELTIIISCYNEASVITEKIANTKALDYPADKIEIIVVDDGSTDATPTLIKGTGVHFIQHADRQGKAAALNTAMKKVHTPVVIFSDANTLLNKDALKLIVRHFTNNRVGGVAGEKKIAATSGLGNAEGWYWKYESFLKKMDAAFYTVIGATGELFALRTELYQSIKEDVILDDFFLSVVICQQGFVIGYEPNAYAIEQPSIRLEEEYNRKVRIAAGAFQSFSYISFQKLLSNPKLLFQLVSRRWLRWIVCPIALPLLLLFNVIIVVNEGAVVYTILLGLQVVFYSLATIGVIIIQRFKNSLLTLPFYFLFMNYCMLAGLIHYICGKQTVFWNKAERSAVS